MGFLSGENVQGAIDRRVAGPNGTGKTTAAPFLLREVFGIHEYVNADPIAAALSAFGPDSVAITAGPVMLGRIDDLARQRVSFRFETTLASRSFAPWLQHRLGEGYAIHLLFLWLASPELAIVRVGQRVQLGGHSVPEGGVRRRYRGACAICSDSIGRCVDVERLRQQRPYGSPPIAMGDGLSTGVL